MGLSGCVRHASEQCVKVEIERDQSKKCTREEGKKKNAKCEHSIYDPGSIAFRQYVTHIFVEGGGITS